MVFNDTTTKDGAIQKCEEWVFGGDYGAISGNANLLFRFTNLLNTGLDKTKNEIYKSDGNWSDDDANYTDYPEDTTDMSNGQSTYLLERSHEIVEGFEVLRTDGKYYPLTVIDYRNVRDDGTSISNLVTPSGLPVSYELSGDVVTLIPAPATGSVIMADGLKIKYKRESSKFVYTDTTKEMGIPRMYQDIPVLFACADYAKTNTMTTKAREIDNEIEKRKNDIKDFFSKRNKDEQPRLTAVEINSI